MRLKKHKDAGIPPLAADRDENGAMIGSMFSVTYRNGHAGPDIYFGYIRKRIDARRREVVEMFAERIKGGEVTVSEVSVGKVIASDG